MLNPDGVIVGNNRCSLSGKDLNRQYRTVMRESYPSVWHTKLMIRRLMEECGIALYCDLHAHSRKHNIFIYGCENKRGCSAKLSEQVFPLMLHKNAADKVTLVPFLFPQFLKLVIQINFSLADDLKLATIASFYPSVFLWELQVSHRERQGRYRKSRCLAHGNSQQLHNGSFFRRLKTRLQSWNALFHVGLRANRKSFLRNSHRFFRWWPC